VNNWPQRSPNTIPITNERLAIHVPELFFVTFPITLVSTRNKSNYGVDFQKENYPVPGFTL
jgi:hypothetical protein